MKTTLELPDDLARSMKARVALEGIKLKDFLEQAVRMRLQHRPEEAPQPPSTQMNARDRRVLEMQTCLQEWQNLGHRIEEESTDPRSMVEMVTSDRR